MVLGQFSYALFDDLAMSGAKTLVQCTFCGMLFDDVAFSEEQLQDYYRRNEHYAESSTGGTGGITEENKARYDRIIEELKPASGGLILDYGCGQGGFTARCLERGLHAVGIEPSEKCRKVGLEAGLEISPSMELFMEGHPKTRIQAVVISHVLEHLMIPLKTLHIIAANNPLAMVYIEVPDASSYLDPNTIRWQEMYFEHLSHFRKESIAQLALNTGIEIIKEGAIPFSQAQSDVRCRFLTGYFRNVPPDSIERMRPGDQLQIRLPEVPGKGLFTGNRPLALWGVSQYAMLLLGSSPILSKVRRLFDGSPAKVGRKIRGVFVEHSSRISTLSQDFVLVLPNSPYRSHMKEILKNELKFNGELVEI
jgi:SAM-dependent methyltransferase